MDMVFTSVSENDSEYDCESVCDTSWLALRDSESDKVCVSERLGVPLLGVCDAERVKSREIDSE